MKISLIHPSRGRPRKALENAVNWLSKASVENEIEHILSVDSDDPDLREYFFMRPVVSLNSCVVEATNKAAGLAQGDILIYLSDDFDCPRHWDKEIVKRVEKVPGPWLLKVHDGLQKFGVPILTIPIMSKALYDKLGYFWHPQYKSMFVDEDLYWTCKNNNWIIEAPELRFQHNHPANNMAPTDATYQRSNANWDQGKAVYETRKKLNFPL